ncbi:MAG: phosphoribosylformylglycinamidine synthase subunit PurQ [Rhodothermaceae bacterium]|nr:phosphoribosylformylglycinamidine synthase subunit PurQ [Rhodothermaceae bacterium]MXX57450.1 phosphoribosylformylglycinamidine synthase subunit PurQ [Rhodothermaceae bacterium]MYD19524.1 phosphoribosylformylglycinamidine synthase subunit PurQ [Rhodothermaceae bacterium]MYD57691.1 phosphoribosylformylglycinamidine synthase subunit PurQ [Rhodothermaceae bacterium]
MRVGVIVFPGSNCDHDAYHVARHVFGLETTFIWHKERELPPVDLVIVPGGFSYGDYLRAGAVARFSLIMDSVVRFAEHGGLVLGICNGFQVLCECGLLPGALLRNASVRFACTWVHLRIDNTDVPYTRNAELGQVLRIPIAHGEGNYYAEASELVELERNGQVVFRYTTPAGEVTPDSNPNGSANNIAGIVNRAGNVLGMMPHPERAAEEALGSRDGAMLFRSLLQI